MCFRLKSVCSVNLSRTLGEVVLVLHCVVHDCSLLEECLNCVHLLVAVPSSQTSSR